MKNGDRILFTSPHKTKGFDFFGYHTRSDLVIQMSQPRIMYPGLRFIKQNFPQIEILEFPSWRDFTDVLKKGWDIVGFSFFTGGTSEILQMADYARKTGVRELWAGNYGALNPLIESNFDKVFIGYSEDKIAGELGFDIGELIHPPLMDSIGIKPIGSPLIRSGWLYTSRGCPMECTFCQTPAFAPKVVKTSIDSIERVLRYYKEHGVQMVLIYDEIFGIARPHAREVVSLLRKYNLPWVVMTRLDVLDKNLDEWHESGLVGVSIGIESVNPATLKDIQKRLTIETTMKVVERLHQRNLIVIGSYIIGFERDTVESVKRDFRELRRLKPDFMKIFVATPFPETALWAQIQRDYGIDTSDWSKFDSKHLVWNHPQLTREDAQMLVEYGCDLFNSEEHVLRVLSKLKHRLIGQKGPLGAHKFFLSSLSNRLHRKVGERHFFD